MFVPELAPYRNAVLPVPELLLTTAAKPPANESMLPAVADVHCDVMETVL